MIFPLITDFLKCTLSKKSANLYSRAAKFNFQKITENEMKTFCWKFSNTVLLPQRTVRTSPSNPQSPCSYCTTFLATFLSICEGTVFATILMEPLQVDQMFALTVYLHYLLPSLKKYSFNIISDLSDSRLLHRGHGKNHGQGALLRN